MPGYRGKRVLDLVLVVGAAPIWLPVLGAVALMVRTRIGAPVLFRQCRLGYADREFRMIKFRSMAETRDCDGKLLSRGARRRCAGIGAHA